MSKALRENAMPESKKHRDPKYANKVFCNRRTYEALHSPAGVRLLAYLVGDKSLVEDPCPENGSLYVFGEMGEGFTHLCLGDGFVERLEEAVNDSQDGPGRQQAAEADVDQIAIKAVDGVPEDKTLLVGPTGSAVLINLGKEQGDG